MSRKPGSTFASASDDPLPYHRRSDKVEAVRFLQNQCRRWLAQKEPDRAIDEGIKMWEQSLIADEDAEAESTGD